MGRSEGKNRLREMLLGGASTHVKTPSRAVIKGELKKKIAEKLLIFKRSSLFSRQKFYEDIIVDLTRLNKEQLLNDPTFLEILNQENRFLKRDIDLSLDEETLKKLAPGFTDSLSSGYIPHLGREFLKSDQIDDKEQLVKSYFEKLAEKESNQESLYSFALNNLLPLAKDNPQFSDDIIKKLASQIASRPGSCQAQKVISPLLVKEALFFKELETKYLQARLEEFFQRDDPYSCYADLEDLVAITKKDAALEAVAVKAVLNQTDLDQSRAKEIINKKNILVALGDALKKDGVKESDQGIYFAKNIYLLFGGEMPGRIDQIANGQPWGVADVYLTLKRVIDSGSTNPDSFYNYRETFLEELSSSLGQVTNIV